jgi:PPOX class probable F420-dependent enzyme
VTPEERKRFLADHRLCVVAYGRKAGHPAQSVVYYAMDGDDLIISTTASRAKAKAIARDPRVSVCVIAEAMPFPYLTVYGRGRIEETQVVETMMKVGERMTGNPIPESARPGIEKRAQDEGRVVLRVTPEGFSP